MATALISIRDYRQLSVKLTTLDIVKGEAIYVYGACVLYQR